MFDKALVWLSILDGIFVLIGFLYIKGIIKYPISKVDNSVLLERECGLSSDFADESFINSLEHFSVCDSEFLKRECGK